MADIEMKREKWKKEQARLRGMLRKVDDTNFLSTLKYVGGVDISFVKNSDKALACFSVMEYPSLKLVETFYYPCIMTEPYMPGFLGFREVDHLVEVVNMFLKKNPQARNQLLIMVDGNGILHYRQFGSASHLGVVLDLPTLGVGKELLVVDGMDAQEIESRCHSELRQFGDNFPLVGPRTGRIFGAAVRTKSETEPIYVSIGHRISLETAIDLVLKCSKNGVLLPEPVRLADGLSRDVIIKNPGLTNYFRPKAAQKQTPPSNPPTTTNHTDTHSTTTTPPIMWNKAKTKLTTPTNSTPPPAKKEHGGKRGAYWECDCGANNPIQSVACEFCYHAKPCDDAGSALAHATPQGASSPQRKKKTWKCKCGKDVVGLDACSACHYINM